MFLILHIIFSQFGVLRGPRVKFVSPGEGNGSGLLVQWLSVRRSWTGLQRASSALCPITDWPREHRFLTRPVSGKQSTIKHIHPTSTHLTAEATFRPGVIATVGFST